MKLKIQPNAAKLIGRTYQSIVNIDLNDFVKLPQEFKEIRKVTILKLFKQSPRRYM